MASSIKPVVVKNEEKFPEYTQIRESIDPKKTVVDKRIDYSEYTYDTNYQYYDSTGKLVLIQKHRERSFNSVVHWKNEYSVIKFMNTDEFYYTTSDNKNVSLHDYDSDKVVDYVYKKDPNTNEVEAEVINRPSRPVYEFVVKFVAGLCK